MMSAVYDVMMDCQTGTKRLTDSTKGALWENCYHVITWCREYSLAEAMKTVASLRGNSKAIKSVWYEEVTV